MRRMTLGVIIGNRDFFPDRLIAEARSDILSLLASLDIDAVMLDEQATKCGSVEKWTEARACANLFRANADRIDGVLVSLPNFGDERGIADALRLSGLKVPVLIQAYPDNLEEFTVERRRDACCGKISVCNNLRQYDIPFSLTTLHTVHPLSDSFRSDLLQFLAVCRIVKGLRGARIGAVGARPGAFNTTRYSEKLLEAAGITVMTLDLSEVIGNANRIGDDDARLRGKSDEIEAYANTSEVPRSSLTRMARFGVVLSEWMKANDLDASALQCWNSIQQNFGVNACTLMSMMSENLMPSACEVDVTGVVAMYALQLASGVPSALVDWNNNYGNDPEKCVFFHCGNWAKTYLPEILIRPAEILGTILGEENTWGAVAGRTPSGPVTFARVSTDDRYGCIRSYVGEGDFTDDPLKTFGARAVVRIPRLQDLLRYICRNGFEHHAAMNGSRTAGAVEEAFSVYLGWDVHHHGSDGTDGYPRARAN